MAHLFVSVFMLLTQLHMPREAGSWHLSLIISQCYWSEDKIVRAHKLLWFDFCMIALTTFGLVKCMSCLLWCIGHIVGKDNLMDCILYKPLSRPSIVIWAKSHVIMKNIYWIFSIRMQNVKTNRFHDTG